MLQILCKTPAAIFKIQILANTKSKFNILDETLQGQNYLALVQMFHPKVYY